MRRAPTLLLALVAALVLLAGCPKPVSNGTRTWQYQLDGPVSTSVDAGLYDVDGFDTSAATVRALAAKGATVTCYLSTSFEDWRSDAAKFPAAVKGAPLDGWAGERWVDIRRLDVLIPIFEARLRMCRAKGFHAVEFDNVDTWSQGRGVAQVTKATGFPITYAHQLAFNKALARAAKAVDLQPGLKNDAEQVADLVPYFGFAIVEECFTYDECEQYLPFARAGKGVFVVEYEADPSRFCPAMRRLGFVGITKSLDLRAPVKQCPA